MLKKSLIALFIAGLLSAIAGIIYRSVVQD